MRLGQQRLKFEDQDYEAGASGRFSLSKDKCVLTYSMGGKRRRLDISDHPRASLSQEFCQHLHHLLASGGHFKTFGTLHNCVSRLANILRNIDRLDPAGRIQRLSDIDGEFIDAQDRPNAGHAHWAKLGALVLFLRRVRDLDPSAVSLNLRPHKLQDRLAIVSRYPKPEFTPRDSYSPYVTQQLKTASDADVQNALDRLRKHRGELESLLQGSPNSLNPATEVLRHLSTHAKITSREYVTYLRGAGLSRQTPTAPIDPAVLGPDIDNQIAARIVAGVDQNSIQREFSLGERHVNHLLRFSPEFQATLGRHEKSYAEETRKLIAVRREREANLEAELRKFRNSVKENAMLWPTQLQLRLKVLRNWRDNGLPLHRVGVVRFLKHSIAKWVQPEYGIRKINPACFHRPDLSAETREIDVVLTDLSQEFSVNVDLTPAVRLQNKIAVLEGWVMEGALSAAIQTLPSTIRQLFEWSDTKLGLQAMRSSRTTRPGGPFSQLVEWAFRLIRVLRFQPRANHVTFDFSIVERPSSLGTRLAPSQDELASFLIALALRCQIDYDSLRNLTRDCLQNANRGFVGIQYRKARRQNQEMTERVRLGGLDTPGGIVKYLIEVTETAHKALSAAGSPDANSLWLMFDCTKNQFGRFTFPPSQHRWLSFCRRHTITSDDGRRIAVLQPSRFRKTVKEQRYRRAKGGLWAIATDNSRVVAQNHYADLPSLERLHDATVARGLRAAVLDAQPHVVADLESIDRASAELSVETGKSARLCKQVIEGKKDTWLAGCLGFDSSPFARKDEDCPEPFSGCLECVNAVFTARKLPNVLRYRDMLVAKLDYLEPADWHRLYGMSIERIDRDILPRFATGQLEEAKRVIAQSLDRDPLFIPPNIERAL